MRNSAAVDRWLVATLLPAYLLLLAAGIHAHLASGERRFPFSLTGAQGLDGFPLVLHAMGEARDRLSLQFFHQMEQLQG